MHKISASKFRLGHSVTWNLVNSPLYFFIAFRLNLILNTYIRCILKFFRIRLVKWFINIEVNYIKLGLIVFSTSKGSFSKIIRQRVKRNRRYSVFPVWNYTYIDQATRYTKLLYKYCARKEHNRKVKWTLWVYDNAPKKRKAFPAIFYYLGKRRSKLKRKKTKWKRSLENVITSRRDSDLVKKRNYFRSIKKFAQFPALQLQHFLNFKLSLMLLKFSKNLMSTNKKFSFKIRILSFIIYLNLFIKKFTSGKKNKAVLRLLDWFQSKNLRYKKIGGGLAKKFKIPKCKLFFDYFSYIKGLNDEFIETRNKFGEIISINNKSVQKLNTPWANFFNTGLFMPYSYKRLVRRLFINFKVKKISNDDFFQIKQDKILLMNYFVKFFVFERNLPTNSIFASKISVNSFFFNRKTLLYRLKKIENVLAQKLVKYDKKLLEIKNILNNNKLYNKIFTQKKLKIYKNSHNLKFSSFLLSGKIPYIWNNVSFYRPHTFDTSLLKSFIYQMRIPFYSKFSLFKNFYNTNFKKIYKFFLLRYIKHIIKCLIYKKINECAESIQKYNLNLITGSKNLEKYIKLFKTQKYFLYAVSSIFNKSDKKEFDLIKSKIYIYILKKFIKLNYNNFYNKFFIRLLIKILKINVLYYRYKIILSKVNDNNYLDIKNQFNMGKKNKKAKIIFDANSYLLSDKKRNLKFINSKNFFSMGNYLYLYIMLRLIIVQRLKLTNIWNLFFTNFSFKANLSNFYNYSLKFYKYLIYFSKENWITPVKLAQSSKRVKQFEKSHTNKTWINNLAFFRFLYFKNAKKIILKFNNFYKTRPSLRQMMNLKYNPISKKAQVSYYFYFQNLINKKLKRYDKKLYYSALKNFSSKNNKFLTLVYYLLLLNTFKKKKSLNFLNYKTFLEQSLLSLNSNKVNFLKKNYKRISSSKWRGSTINVKKILSTAKVDFDRIEDMEFKYWVEEGRNKKLFLKFKDIKKFKEIADKIFLKKQENFNSLFIKKFLNDLETFKKKIILSILFDYRVRKLFRLKKLYRLKLRAINASLKNLKLREKFRNELDFETEFVTFYKLAQKPLEDLSPKFRYLTKEEIIYRMFKFYHRVDNAFERKYELDESTVRRRIAGVWTPITKIRKFYENWPEKAWSAVVFEPNRWKIKGYYPPVYRKIYGPIKRLEDKIYKPTMSSNDRYQARFAMQQQRKAYNNNLKIARNLGKQLFFRKIYLTYMFAINWAKEEDSIQKNLFVDDYAFFYNKGYIGFFPKNRKTKKIDFSFKIGFNKNIFNFRKSEFYKNKCVLGLNATQVIRNKWQIFNNYLKKKIGFDLKNIFLNENEVVSNSNSHKFFVDLFSKIYYNKHPKIWSIKKKVFFDKIFWWNYKYRLIRAKQEQQKRRKCTRKSRFKACVRVRKDYKYGMRMITSSVIANQRLDIRGGFKFSSIQLFLKNDKNLFNFNDRYFNFYKFYHELYPENVRTDMLEDYDFANDNILTKHHWFRGKKTVTLRKINWHRYWLKFAKMLNVFRYWTNIGKPFKRSIYFKFSLSKKLQNFKTIQYYAIKFYKFKNLLLLDDLYLKLMKFASNYILNRLTFIPDFFISQDYYKLIILYFNNKSYTSQLKLLTLNNYLSLFLRFNINFVNYTSSFRFRKLYFKSKKNNYKFGLKRSLYLIKNILYMFSKFENSNFFYNFNGKSVISYSNNDFLSNSFVTPKFNYLRISDETKFIKLLLSKNMDFSLFNILNYKESLTRLDFVIAFKYIIYNNLVKFFKSTKLEKNFIKAQYALKFYFLWIIKLLFLKKFSKLKFFKKKINNIFSKKIYNSLVYEVSLSFSINYFINYNIATWKNYQRLSRKANTFFKYWLKKKKFLFWITQEFEKDLRQKIDVYFINSLTAITTVDRFNGKNFLKVVNWILSPWNARRGWRNNIIFTDILWTTLISMKYHCVSFLAENISRQLCKRKKHWRYIHTIKKLISRTLPGLQFRKGIGDLHTVKISINGKVNGRDRSINYIFFKKVKDKQKPRTHQLYLSVNYGFREALSRYGVFAIKIWFSRV